MTKVLLCLFAVWAWPIFLLFVQSTPAQMLEFAIRFTCHMIIGLGFLYLADKSLTAVSKAFSKRNRRHTRTVARREYTPVSGLR